MFRAWKRLCGDPDWDALLAVIGTGGELSNWKRTAEEAALADRLRFLGHIRNVPEVLAACDLLVHPARYEAYGLGVQEALCRGLPAIVSASAGVAERYPIDLQDLLLPDPENAEDLAEGLLRWRRDLERYRERVKPLADSIRARTWDDMAAELVQVIEDPS
ncbi:hypothetical protein BH23PLA1_BH23PLA1_22550 [soil metagenome]